MDKKLISTIPDFRSLRISGKACSVKCSRRLNHRAIDFFKDPCRVLNRSTYLSDCESYIPINTVADTNLI